ncbi:hypothetical protein [Colwellia psychrerythraea]|uniref:Uncharacterized protein n=1 Tax=Colwellia psychrerythraea TaxID=28229 RepID=A0A099K871_COLPS|nr:hypothetical protein [Colwellia psychrerythraea]KGJ86536.1 hypothetical protein GAB14E_0809 [Colwellia psychrerythraea]
MSTTDETFDMVANSEGKFIPNKITLNKALHQKVCLSVKDENTVVHCQFYIHLDGKSDPIGEPFVVSIDNSKTYNSSDYSDRTYYLVSKLDKSELTAIKPEQLQLVDGHLVGAGEGGSGRIIIDN